MSKPAKGTVGPDNTVARYVRRERIPVEDIAYRPHGAGPSRRGGDLGVCHRFPLWNTGNHLVHETGKTCYMGIS